MQNIFNPKITKDSLEATKVSLEKMFWKIIITSFDKFQNLTFINSN
jgi:hypothetical protein